MTTATGYFESTIATSIEAAVLVGLLLFLTRGLRGKVSPAWRYALWFVLLAKLLLPWMPGDMESRLQWINVPDKLAHPLEANEAVSAITATRMDGLSTGVSSADESTALSVPANDDERYSWLGLATWIWIVGMAMILATIGTAYVRAIVRLRKTPALGSDHPLHRSFARIRRQLSVRDRIRLKLTDVVKAPALFGVLRPVVLLPLHLEGRLSEADWECIFRHELMHFKRRDVPTNALFALLAAVHWFNPAIWYGLHRMRIDQEEACDASVLAKAELRETYASCMVKVLEIGAAGRIGPAGVGFSGYKNQLKRRIRMIRGFKPTRGRLSLLGLAVIALSAAVMLPSTFATSDETAKPSASVSDLAAPDDPVPAREANEQPAFMMPAAGKLASPYGERVHPVTLEKELHDGIDIVNAEETPVVAAADGEVLSASYDSVNGNRIVIRHNDAWSTEYRHLSVLSVQRGQQVKSGETIGLMGSTGQATGPHLHFSVFHDDDYVDPIAAIRVQYKVQPLRPMRTRGLLFCGSEEDRSFGRPSPREEG